MTAPSAPSASPSRARDRGTTHAIAAWVVLMVLTGATWWLGADHDLAGLGRDAAMIGILVLTFGKIYVVGHTFMEMREAAAWLHRAFLGWCVALCLTLSVLYLYRVA